MAELSEDRFRAIAEDVLKVPHAQNRKDIHDVKGSLETLGNRVALVEFEVRQLRKDFGQMEASIVRLDLAADRFDKLADKEEGRQEAKKELMENRDREVNKSSNRAMWAAVMATIAAAILGVLLGWVLTHRTEASRIISSDDSVTAFYNSVP